MRGDPYTYTSTGDTETVFLDSFVNIYPSKSRANVDCLFVGSNNGLLEVFQRDRDSVFNAGRTSPCRMTATFYGERALIQSSCEYQY
jgi:hypothetical protein